MFKRFFDDEHKGRKVLKIVGGVIAGIMVAVALSFIIGVIVMLLWNWLMPELFGLGEINYWQGFGIVLFVKLLFSNGGSRKETKSGSTGKTYSHHGKDRDHEKTYEEWWESEGRVSFNEYMQKKQAGVSSGDVEGV
jgi:hypothetical protein